MGRPRASAGLTKNVVNDLGLDATYALDPQPTGVAVYSRHLITGLAQATPPPALYYRWHRYRQLPTVDGCRNGPRRLLVDCWAPDVRIFHGLNQRLPRRIRHRAIATFHDLFVLTAEYSEPSFRQRFAAFARDAAERADAIIAVSRFTANQVQELLRVEPARITVIPHGVTAAKRSARRERLLLHVGAIQRRKNLVRLVEAFSALPPDWKLVLAGGAGYGAGEVFAAIAASPRRADILTPGYLAPEQLEEYYDRASLVAFPSLGEGFGLPVLEAMARGIPVVTAARSATQEIAGSAAILVHPERTEELAEALRSLALDPDRQARLVEAGLRRAAEYTWDRAVTATMALYRQVQ